MVFGKCIPGTINTYYCLNTYYRYHGFIFFIFSTLTWLFLLNQEVVYDLDKIKIFSLRYNFGLLPRENPTAVMKKLNREHSKLMEEKASIAKELEALRLKAGITLSTKDASCSKYFIQLMFQTNDY